VQGAQVPEGRDGFGGGSVVAMVPPPPQFQKKKIRLYFVFFFFVFNSGPPPFFFFALVSLFFTLDPSLPEGNQHDEDPRKLNATGHQNEEG
jgi:hypothetical protein